MFILGSMHVLWLAQRFMNSIVGFIAGLVSFMVAVSTAKPFSNMTSKWFNMPGWIHVLICMVIIYAIVRLLFFILTKFVRKIKDDNRVIDKIDRIAGIILGVAKCTVCLAMFFLILSLLSHLSFIVDINAWLFKKSLIGEFLYNFVVDYIKPLLGPLAAAVWEQVSGK